MCYKRKVKGKFNWFAVITFTIIQLFSIGSKAQVLNSSKYDNVINIGSRTIFKDGVSKTYYIENGISVTASMSIVNEYGRYYKLNLEIENLTGKEFNFNPNELIAIVSQYEVAKKTNILSVKSQEKRAFLSSEEYLQKVNNRQNLSSALNSWNKNQDAEQAGYSQTIQATKVVAAKNSYGTISDYYNNSVDVESRSVYSGGAVSASQSYDGQAAYMAKKDAEKSIKEFDQTLYEVKSELQQGYLKINTIENRQRLTGFINLKFEEAGKLEVLVPVNGKYYSFVFSNNSQPERTPNSQVNDNVSNINEVNQLFKEARSYYINKNITEFEKSVNKAIEIEPKNYKLYQLRIYAYTNNPDKIENLNNDLSKIIELNPNAESYARFLCTLHFQCCEQTALHLPRHHRKSNGTVRGRR